MPVQLFADESLESGNGCAFVLAGFLGEAKAWIEFSNEWESVLSESPRISYFKTTEADRLCEQFTNWKRVERDKKVAALAEVIKRHPLTGIHCTLDYDAFVEIIKPDIPRKTDDAYFLAFHSLIASVCGHMLGNIRHLEPCELFFDEHPIFGSRAKAWYPFVKEVVLHNMKSLLPPEPIFRDDKEWEPLQAADMFAWLFRNTCNKKPTELDWLVEVLKDVPLSPNSQFILADRMREMVSEAYAYRTLTPELVARFKAFTGESPFVEDNDKEDN